jgi:hypothetical protein
MKEFIAPAVGRYSARHEIDWARHRRNPSRLQFFAARFVATRRELNQSTIRTP